MAWGYAELSKMAKNNGGPEKLVEMLIKSGEKKVYPLIGAAFVGGGLFAIVGQKIYKHFSQKNGISVTHIELVKKELIQGIKDYDAAQATIVKEIIQEPDGGTNRDKLKSEDKYEPHMEKKKISHLGIPKRS
jgi:hypothetical protein